jgi:adenylyltransferase/sulfurtransferase
MTEHDKERYSRQILFQGLGEQGQEKLLAAKAVIVGCGALGSFHADALARAGVGEITIVDRDYVEISNLQRQWLFDEEDAAQALPKAAAAAAKLRRINSRIRVEPRVADLTPENAEELLKQAGVVLDGTDNFETRYLINDVAVKLGIPWIYGAAVGSYGLTMPIFPAKTACLACVFPEPPGGAQPTCDTAGVLNAVTASIAAFQVADAIKILAGRAEAVEPRLLTIDVWKNTFHSVGVASRDPECPACGRGAFKYLEGARRRPVTLCGRNAVQVHESPRRLDLAELKTALQPLGEVRANEYALRFSCPPYEMTVFADGRAIIKGTEDVGVARSLYARYVGT